jgi:hypothetical protein
MPCVAHVPDQAHEVAGLQTGAKSPSPNPFRINTYSAFNVAI